ncbi:(3-dehydroquinate dehydratase) [Agrilactobacillus composti DSM 18527 = JCM 14202]|uniref:3-dehydroquinate dehydratase n=1 Tax=Agrilactobacillus composti DSM 18527 = JCM 14202 TaxID=1423734 RepID=X0QPV2_9LACO|nr:type I 3-dehydroquinate dehydratase [Agrilactobacillus composti]KRM32837.1 (3-dehydroquinate dehydratase) [Agrilactobacillus composti DSM 18527 = JCM 14202]GAF40645.1 3-dehydroquinate dehydratase I [Agrilactobacillus composti DSM 18527 = JCM 14202]
MSKQGVKVRNIVLGQGRPKIAVPITGKTKAAVLQQAEEIANAKPDIVEWRIDFFEGITDKTAYIETAKALRATLGDLALLTTFRTKGEGGELLLSENDYFGICKTVISAQQTDAIDVELYHDETQIKSILQQAKVANVVVIMSNHDFNATPAKAEIKTCLKKMIAYGADVAKMAVMPQNTADVLELLAATNEASSELTQPVITMSMGNIGKVSRISGEAFGSALTFATVGAASAPGQIPIQNLRQDLEDLKL